MNGSSSELTNGGQGTQITLEQQELKQIAAENESLVDGTGDKEIIYDQNKMENYLLNPNHPQGKSKAKFLKDVLGYSKGDGRLLHDNICKAVNGLAPVKVTYTKFGTKFEYDAKLQGVNGKNIFAHVVVVLQNDKGKTTYRVITLYPKRRDK